MYTNEVINILGKQYSCYTYDHTIYSWYRLYQDIDFVDLLYIWI